MFIMSKNRTKTWCKFFANINFCNEDRYIGIISRRVSISASIATLIAHATCYSEVRGSNSLGGFLFFHIQMFFYAIAKLFITLHRYVNKSSTRAISVSLSFPSLPMTFYLKPTQLRLTSSEPVCMSRDLF
jgi:hypothetical protein